MKSTCYFLLFILISLLLSCKEPSLEKDGGIRLTIAAKEDISQSDFQKTKAVLKERLASISPFPEHVSIIEDNNQLQYNIPGLQDTAAVRQLTERNRMMRLAHAIPTRDFPAIREYLSDYITVPKSKKPYKPESMIGLVSYANQAKLEEILNSQDFREAFPQVANHYYGVKSMDSKLALFLEVDGSAIIDERMYAKVDVYEGEDPEEGIMTLLLNEDYATSLGPLTGNDSTYLLHIFHDEVYISKIIVPYIEGPAFSMSGAFSPRDVEVLTTIWKHDPLPISINVKEMELMKK